MAAAETSEIFPCTQEQFYSLVSDYEKYPQFLTEVKNVKVLKVDGQKKLVEFQVAMIKSFTYRLWIRESPPHRIHWELESGDIFKTSEGSWDLTDIGGKTKAHYKVEATFKVFVPGPVAKALVNVNLPNMMKSYHEQVRKKFAGGTV